MHPHAPRILFYSHDTFGLGHIRRTLAICDVVARARDDASVLVLTGSSAMQMLRLPRGVDYVKLPCVTKLAHETYAPKFLQLQFDAVRQLRDDIILSTTVGFGPTLVFVDNVPLGMKGELTRTLQFLRANHPETRVILTLRDIVDEPERVIEQWTASAVYQALDQLYDGIIVYGSPRVFDLVREYRLPPQVARKVQYAGYIDRTAALGPGRLRRELAPRGERVILVTVGGGGDGQELVDCYLEGWTARPDRRTERSVVVLGPDMPADHRDRVRASHGHRRDLLILDACDDLTSWMAAADAVVSMGGYNTVCEILALGKPAVVVPRVHPRLEQWIRCSRLAELGLVDTLHPEQATPARLQLAVQRALSRRPPASRSVIPFDGLRHVADVVRALTLAPLPMGA